ncbi:MAG TPA: hypothetical protein VL359_16735 [bacterium]|nr:hypothetical protein [bacterium]
MLPYILALHGAAIALVVGILFVQSLAVVMALRLQVPEQREGVRILQGRVHVFVYYPILAVALASGLWLALRTDAFSQGQWLRWKLVLVVVLIGLGFLTGWAIRAQRVLRPLALLIHILIFIVAMIIIYLATTKPF